MNDFTDTNSEAPATDDVAPVADADGPAAETSMEDDLSAAYDKLAAGEDISDDADGEGASTPPEGEQATDAIKPDDSTEVDSTQPAKTPDEQADVSAYWSDETRAKFAGLDEKAQTFVKDVIADQNADYTRKAQELAGFRQEATQVHEAIAPFTQNIQASGATPVQAIRALFQTEHVMRHGTPEEKAQQLQALADQYGVQLPSSNQDDLDIDDFDAPTVAPLKRELDEMRSKLAQSNQQLQQFQNQFQQQQSRQFGEAQTKAQAFIDAKADDGTLKHPHVEKVAPQMRALLMSGDLSLEQAYNTAVQANPELAAQVSREAQAREQAKKAAAAKRAVGDRRSQVRQSRDESTGRYIAPDNVEQAAADAYDQLASNG